MGTMLECMDTTATRRRQKHPVHDHHLLSQETSWVWDVWLYNVCKPAASQSHIQLVHGSEARPTCEDQG